MTTQFKYMYVVFAVALLAWLTGCKTEREILQDKVNLLVQVSEHTEPGMLLLNYMGAPKEDLDAEEGLLVLPADFVREDMTGFTAGTEFVLVVSRRLSDQDEGPNLKIYDPAAGTYSETSYSIIEVKPKESLD